RDRRVAGHDEDDEPERSTAEERKRREGKRHAGSRRNHLPALPEPEEDRARVAEHGRGACEHADYRSPRPEPEKRGRRALPDVEQGDGRPEPPPVDAEHVRGADVPATPRADGAPTDDRR